MTSPLARSPVATPCIERVEPEVATARPGFVTRVVREARHTLSFADGRRLAWGATRVLPEFMFSIVRARLLSVVGCDVRRGVGVLGFVHLSGPKGCAANLRIGQGSIIGPNVTFCLDAPITLGTNVSIGPKVMLYTASHPIGGPARRMQLNPEARPIVVGDGAWIGLGAMVLPGVRIGRGAIVSAGSVVGNDVPDNVLAAGNPAQVVQELPVF